MDKPRAARCRHYRGTVHDTCAAGVTLRELVGGSGPDWTRLPCHPAARADAVRCDKYEPETVEERKAAVAKLMRAMDAVGPILREIKETCAGRDAAGTRTCPVCGGRLQFWHSAYNGHVWLRCETPDCMALME